MGSRRFQPADNRDEGIASTPTGLTGGPAPSRPVYPFRLSFRGFHPRLFTVCPFGATPSIRMSIWCSSHSCSAVQSAEPQNRFRER